MYACLYLQLPEIVPFPPFALYDIMCTIIMLLGVLLLAAQTTPMLLYTLDHVPVLFLSAKVFCYYPSETILHYVLCVLRMLCLSWLYLCVQASMKKFIQDVLVSSNIVHYPFCQNCFEDGIIKCCVGNIHQRVTLLSLDLILLENISARGFIL